MELKERPSYRDKYSVIIPAAGMGRRMKIYGPKSLISINKKHTILSKQLMGIGSCFRRHETILVGGFEVAKIPRDKRIQIIVNKEYETTNVLHSIHLGLDRIKNNKVVVVYGDLVFNKQCLNLPFHNESAIVVCNTMKEEEVGCTINDGKLEHMFYGLPNKWCQIAFFTGKELEMLRELSHNKMWFGFEAINEIMNRGGTFKVFNPRNAKAIDIDCSYDLKLLDKK